MSTKRSVGRITAAQDKVRGVSTQAKVRSTATHNTARSAATQENGRPARKSKKDRSPNLCAFAFADGRQCRMPRCSGHLHYCYFHAQKEAESLAAQQVGEDISRFLPTKLLTACDLGVAMSQLFCAVARGDVKPKVASTLAYLAQTMLQSIPIAQHEYCEALGTGYWRSAIRSSFNVTAPEPKPAPQPQSAPSTPPPTPKPTPQPASQPARPAATPAVCHSERSEEPASSSNSSLATHHSPLPQPAALPHTPLPSTSAEFAMQLLAGPTSSRSAIPTLPEPGRETGSSRSSSSSTAPAVPQSPVNCHSEPAARQEEPAASSVSSSSNSSLTTHHSPLPQPVPPSVPPGFGAPANWDVLIPPKPRRRFSRHWHLLD
jgi:hypothetical protein